MGPTGSGKTEFINLVAGTALAVGHGSEACTTRPETVTFQMDGQHIVLIDTPGFDAEDDAVDNRKTAQFLRLMYKEGKEIAGAIYTHRICDNRMSHAAIQNFNAFNKICSDCNVNNVAIVTNMWGRVQRSVGEARERELRTGTHCYGTAVQKGAKLLRHEGTIDSARSILQGLLTRETVVPQYQHDNDTAGCMRNLRKVAAHPVHPEGSEVTGRVSKLRHASTSRFLSRVRHVDCTNHAKEMYDN